jgi:hypothetical protein
MKNLTNSNASNPVITFPSFGFANLSQEQTYNIMRGDFDGIEVIRFEDIVESIKFWENLHDYYGNQTSHEQKIDKFKETFKLFDCSFKSLYKTYLSDPLSELDEFDLWVGREIDRLEKESQTPNLPTVSKPSTDDSVDSVTRVVPVSSIEWLTLFFEWIRRVFNLRVLR